MNLFHFIDWIMQLPKDLDRKLREEIVRVEVQTAKPYVSSIARIALEEGREEGKHESALRILLHLLNHRFSQVPDALQQQLATLKAEQLEQLVDLTLSADTLDEFIRHLPAPKDR